MAARASRNAGRQKISNAGQWPDNPPVVIISTGGTIASRFDPTAGAAAPRLSAKELAASLRLDGRRPNIEFMEFCNINSTWMTPEIWIKLARLVREVIEKGAAGVVITHGTDTMAETAFFMDTVIDTDVPVVFTGAMRTATAIGADGPANLADAIAQAGATAARGWGVTVTMNNHIHAAQSVRKTDSMNPQAFSSGTDGVLGTIYNGKITRIHDRPAGVRMPLPDSLPDVPLIRHYTGMDGAFIRLAADNHVAGLVIEAGGCGNVNPATAAALEYALAKDVTVVAASICGQGGAHAIYGTRGGGAELARTGVIMSGRLDGARSRILLMLALAASIRDRPALAALFDRFNHAANG